MKSSLLSKENDLIEITENYPSSSKSFDSTWSVRTFSNFSTIDLHFFEPEAFPCHYVGMLDKMIVTTRGYFKGTWLNICSGRMVGNYGWNE